MSAGIWSAGVALLLGGASLMFALSKHSPAFGEANAAQPFRSTDNLEDEVWPRSPSGDRLLLIGGGYRLETAEPRWVF